MTTHEEELNTVPSDSSTASAMEPSPMLQDPNLPVSGIEDPSDTDVLCGRGGAALRHPGNQTYRRLVHLNKGLYITCLKAEKLKISRSIVAAIREQNGRFLEKNAKKGTWYDIGDKKAMEKTSQALREGQPKLRQKIVELGGGAAGAAALLETQFPGTGPGGYQGNPAAFPASSASTFDSQQAAAAAAVAAATAASHQNTFGAHRAMASSAAAVAPANGLLVGSGGIDHATANNVPRRGVWDTSSPEFMQRLSLEDENPQIMLRTSFNLSRGGGGDVNDLAMAGLGDSQQTLLHANTFMTESPTSSALNLDVARMNLQSSQPADDGPRPFPPSSHHQDSDSESNSEPPPPVKVDRRGVFAKMKYERPASGKFNSSGRQLQASGRSLGSALSYSEVGSTSIMSNMTGSSEDNAQQQPHFQQYSQNNHPKVPTVAEVFGGGSRRSVMSGLSKISDADNSIISDLSKKIGNVSTRSLLSEISGMDEESVDVTIDTRDLPAAPPSSIDDVDGGDRLPQDG